MGKLYFHCGIFTPDQFSGSIEVLGSLTATGAEMSKIGVDLRVPDAGDRCVFSNNDNVFNGMRVSISKGLIDPENLVVLFSHVVDNKPQVTHVMFDKNGCADYWPAGFFDQIENDLMDIAGWK